MANDKSTFEIDFIAKDDSLNAVVNRTERGLDTVNKGAIKTSKSTNMFSKTVSTLTTKLRIMSTVGLIGIVTGLINAGKALFNFNKQLAETTKLVSDLTGKSGDDLQKFTAQVQATADVFKQDFNEVLLAANTVSKELGITQEDALKRIQDGFINGSDASGQFLDILKEYPAQFRAAGLSADETFAIINQSVEQGIFSDKGPDVIKEASIRLREMTKATTDALEGIGLNSSAIQKGLEDGTKTLFEVIQEVSTELSKLPPESAKVGTAIADIFGGPGEDAGLRFLTTLKDIDVEQQKLNENLTEAQQLQKQQLENQSRWNELLAEFFGEAGTGFSQIIADLTTIGLDLLTGIIDTTRDVIRFFEDLTDKSKAFRFIVNGTVETFKLLGKTAFGVVKLIGEGFESVGDIIEGVFTLDTEKIKQGFTNFGNEFLELNKQIFTDINTAVKEIQQEQAISTEEAIANRRMERFQAEKQAETTQALAIAQIRTNAMAKANARILADTKKLNSERFKSITINTKAETDVKRTAAEEQQSFSLASSLAEIDFTKNAGSQIIGVFKSQAIAALIKSILAGVPFPANIIAAGGAGAIANSLFDSIPAFQNGVENGFIGGNSFSGDRMLARVNSGEAILNPAQQRNFINLATGGGGDNSMLMTLVTKVDELITEVVFGERNFNITNMIDVTPTDFLEITEQGTRDRAVRAGNG